MPEEPPASEQKAEKWRGQELVAGEWKKLYACLVPTCSSTREIKSGSEAATELTSGREEGRRRGLRERERHIERRQADLAAAAAAAAAATSACKK